MAWQHNPSSFLHVYSRVWNLSILCYNAHYILYIYRTICPTVTGVQFFFIFPQIPKNCYSSQSCCHVNLKELESKLFLDLCQILQIKWLKSNRCNKKIRSTVYMYFIIGAFVGYNDDKDAVRMEWWDEERIGTFAFKIFTKFFLKSVHRS